MAGTRTGNTHPARASPVVCVKVSSLVVLAAPPVHPNTICTFEMSALELYSCSELSADIRVGAFTTLNFTFDPLTVAHLADIWREFARHDLSARIAKLALQGSAEQRAKTVLLLEGGVGEKDA